MAVRKPKVNIVYEIGQRVMVDAPAFKGEGTITIEPPLSIQFEQHGVRTRPRQIPATYWVKMDNGIYYLLHRDCLKPYGLATGWENTAPC